MWFFYGSDGVRYSSRTREGARAFKRLIKTYHGIASGEPVHVWPTERVTKADRAKAQSEKEGC